MMRPLKIGTAKLSSKGKGSASKTAAARAPTINGSKGSVFGKKYIATAANPAASKNPILPITVFPVNKPGLFIFWPRIAAKVSPTII